MFTDRNGDLRYKVGLHVHTTESDGRVSPESAAKIYRDAGYDAIAFTDHWVYGRGGTLGGLKILPGCEYHVGQADTVEGVMHIVGIGMREDPGLVRDKSTRQEIVDGIRAAGGLAVLAHPMWSLNTPQDALALSGIEATEIYNTVSAVDQSFRPYSGYFVDLLCNAGRDLALIATDDTHYYDGTDNTKSYICVRAAGTDTEDILAAVRARDFYATQGPELLVRRQGNTFIVDCSPSEQISFVTNSCFQRGRVTRGTDCTHAEYTPKPYEKWLRVEILSNGLSAWSNIFRI